MDEQTIIARLDKLKHERQTLIQQMAQIEPKVAAYDGAIEDCKYWLNELRSSQPVLEEAANGTAN